MAKKSRKRGSWWIRNLNLWKSRRAHLESSSCLLDSRVLLSKWRKQKLLDSGFALHSLRLWVMNSIDSVFSRKLIFLNFNAITSQTYPIRCPNRFDSLPSWLSVCRTTSFFSEVVWSFSQALSNCSILFSSCFRKQCLFSLQPQLSTLSNLVFFVFALLFSNLTPTPVNL